MAWNTPVDLTTGTVVTASQLNNQIGATGSLAQTAPAKITTNGDLVYGTGANALARLGIGSTGQVLNVSGGLPVWGQPIAISEAPMNVATLVLASASGWTDITGCSLSLTAGQYLLLGSAAVTGNGASNAWWFLRFYNSTDSAEIHKSEDWDNLGTTDMNRRLIYPVGLSATKTIKLQTAVSNNTYTIQRDSNANDPSGAVVLTKLAAVRLATA